MHLGRQCLRQMELGLEQVFEQVVGSQHGKCFEVTRSLKWWLLA